MVGGSLKTAVHDPVRVTNRDATSPWIIVCDHASNHIPAEMNGLGLAPADLQRHIAWDPGARPVAAALAALLDAVLVESCVSRLVIDCNRRLDAEDLIAAVSETTEIPGNVGLSDSERARRIEMSHIPFHDAVHDLLEDRLSAGRVSGLVTIHSFTPVYRGVFRPWHIGVLHDDDDRVARPLAANLRSVAGIEVGMNQPYSPADGVYYTLERHARSRSLPCVMIEIRNDEIADTAAHALWAGRLATALSGIEEPVFNLGVVTASTTKGHPHRA